MSEVRTVADALWQAFEHYTQLSSMADSGLARDVLDAPIIGPAHAPVVLDGVTVEGIADAVHEDAAAQEVVSVTIEHNRRGDDARVLNVQVDYQRIILSILAHLSVAIPEGYGTVCAPTWSRHSDGTSIYHTVETHETGNRYKAPMGQRVAFLGKKGE